MLTALISESTRTPHARPARSLAAEARFRQALAEAGAVLLEPVWLGALVPHRVRCAAGHECAPRPGDIQQGQGICRTCAGKDPATAEAAFRARLAELGAVLLEAAYLGKGRPHRVRCAAGHECAPRPGDVRRGSGICRTCAGQDPAMAEAAFRQALAELGAVLLETAWLGSGKPHRVRCAAGHECAPLPNNVRRGSGICRTCAGYDPATAEARFRQALAEAGAVLLEPVWLGALVPHRVRCAAGHECAPRPNSVQQGAGPCRLCAGKIWDAFYVVADRAAARIKFGITSGDPRPRLRAHRAGGYGEIVRLMVGLPGSVAPELEAAALAALMLAGFRPVHGREYYDAAALPVVLDIADHYPGAPLS